MTQVIDKNTSWYQESVGDEMNRFYDKEIKNQDIRAHLGAFTTLLARTHIQKCAIIDLGCGTAMLSDFCNGFTYHGADLPHVIGKCAMRNYPQYYYKACDLITDNLEWIKQYPIAVLNGVIDVMQFPMEVLERVLANCQEYLIIHRQEITEAGETHSKKDGLGYGGPSYHSVIARKDFNELLDRMHFSIVEEIPLSFGNWENGGRSFLLRRRKSFALYEIDYKLYEKYFRGKENGFFIEAGANDGLAQSNTYYLEFFKNWKGICIEPLPEQHSLCERFRSVQTHKVHAALVDDDSLCRIDMLYTPSCNGLMSVIDNEQGKKLMRRSPDKGIPLSVPAMTLNRVLNNFLDVDEEVDLDVSRSENPLHIDLLVLDVEGYELNALRGLDLQSPYWNIDYILVEELEETDEIQSYLAQFGYQRIDKLSHHDYLYKKP